MLHDAKQYSRIYLAYGYTDLRFGIDGRFTANGLYPAACAIVILMGPSAKKLAGISGVCYNSSMEKKVYTTDELNHASKEELVGIILSLQENIAQMLENQELIIEQAAMVPRPARTLSENQ